MAKIYKALILLFLVLLPVATEAATFYFSPGTSNYGVGENFKITILVSSNQSVNAVSGVFNFPTGYMEAISLNVSNSVVNFWVQNPSFSNAGNKGNIHFEGVILNPGFIGSGGKVIEAAFRVKKAGSASVNFSESSILANDGLGTNVTVFPSPATYTFIESIGSETPMPEKINTDLSKRIEAVEKKIKAVAEAPKPVPIVIVQKPQLPSGLLGFWEILPPWIKIGALFLIGVAVLILLFIVVTLGIVILIWPWSRIWRRKFEIKKFLKRVLSSFGVIEKEIEEDIAYGSHELKKEFQYAKKSHSLRLVLKNYWITLHQVVKKFFTKQNKTKE